MADTAQERTEQPTANRRARARGEGRVPRSTELSAAASVLAGAALLAWVSGGTFAELAHGLMHSVWGSLSLGAVGPDALAGLTRSTAGRFLAAYAGFGAGVFLIVSGVNLVQAKGVVSWHPVTPKLENLHPSRGLRKMFQLEALVTGLKALFKVTAITAVTAFVLSRTLPDLTVLPWAGAAETVWVFERMALRLTVLLGFAYLFLAGADYLFQVHQHEKSLRMTRQEVKHDHKDMEGDPHVKGKILGMARANARRRMLQQVPEADVVVVNPIRIAVALKYDVSLAAAPVVVAMGQRKLAARIREIASRAGVPIVENKPVARALLATGKVGRPIPPALYTAVAEILAWVYRQRNRGADLLAARSAR